MIASKEMEEAMPRAQLDPRELWYASDRRIRTEAAAREARRVHENVMRRWFDTIELDEQELFVALHTCAFNAARPARGKKISERTRMTWARRWEDIRDYIVERNMGLVYSMVGRFTSQHLDEDDRLSEAMFALTRSVDRFNPWRGFKFSTYACNVIARALMRRGKQESNHRRLFPVQHDLSFERPTGMPDTDTELFVERLQRVLNFNLGELNDLETKILSHRFPADREPRLTFQEIGNTVGLSKERVRQIQNIALDKLREVLDEDPVLQ